MTDQAQQRKYEFTGETKVVFGTTIRRIRALFSFCAAVKAGDLGGWLADEKNLPHFGDAWVSGNAHVYGNARVSGDAWVLLGQHKVKDICILQIQGSMHSVCSPDGIVIKIGCQERTPQDWKENFESVGKSNGYTDAQIVEYKRYIDLFAAVLVERNN